MNKEEFVKFRIYLIGPEGCDFNLDEGTWKCAGDFALSVKLLKKYFPEENTNKFIERCKELGAFCDCELSLLDVESI